MEKTKYARALDALTVTERLNEDVDDGSCVVGHEKTVCLIATELPL